MAKILVVGCGDIGYRVALALHELGHAVVGVKRRPLSMPAPFPVVAADISQVGSLQCIPTDFELVLFIVSPGSRQIDAYRALYEFGLSHLLAHLADAKPRWLMVSSSSVYGQNRGEWVDENSPTRPLSPTAQCLVAAEQQLWSADASHCVVRFSGIYGPGRNWLLRRAAQGEAIQRNPPAYTNRIHSDDCVGVLSFLVEKLLQGKQLHACYLASDNEPAPIWDVMNWIARQYAFPVPPALDLATEAEQNKRCGNARLTALGYEFRFPSYRDGYVRPPVENLYKPS